ncbi:MAG: hypothetical protein HFE77_05020 [Clostridiales bacterium]|nr:hypothetical protein [Clostridiales bacterium]
MQDIIDSEGKVHIPWLYRYQLNLMANEPVKVELRLHEIVISKQIWHCVFCKSTLNLVRLGKTCACKRCINRLYDAKSGDILEEKPVD